MDQPDNVIQMPSKKSVLPRVVRATLKGQYVESQERGDSPEKFIESLEIRLMTNMAYFAYEGAKEFLDKTFGDSDGK